VAEARALIVQGSEAGGHNRVGAATSSLPPAVVDVIDSVPVVAAGGIAEGRTVAAALALGAEAVWVGTRLIASFEANGHPEYKDRIVAAGLEDTTGHLIFGPEFPDASTRGLRNRIVREWERRIIVQGDALPSKIVRCFWTDGRLVTRSKAIFDARNITHGPIAPIV
jgi:NAD(P)H-dependent flavin oxidoreductase YrpB (nitropropane dioxygenase family)